MRRWLVLSLGIGIAALAGYELLTGSSATPAGSKAFQRDPGGARGGADSHAGTGAEAQDEIGDESRQRLREILRDAGGEEVRTP